MCHILVQTFFVKELIIQAIKMIHVGGVLILYPINRLYQDGIIDVQCCNCCHLLSDFSSMANFNLT